MWGCLFPFFCWHAYNNLVWLCRSNHRGTADCRAYDGHSSPVTRCRLLGIGVFSNLDVIGWLRKINQFLTSFMTKTFLLKGTLKFAVFGTQCSSSFSSSLRDSSEAFLKEGCSVLITLSFIWYLSSQRISKRRQIPVRLANWYFVSEVDKYSRIYDIRSDSV